MTDLFAEKVAQQIERLRSKPCSTIEAEVAAKRVAWYANRTSPRPTSTPPTPRDAYELLFFDYMGLQPDDVAVVSESADEIVWRSVNPCPTLDACHTLNLNTRKVCRDAYEKSTQALVSQLDPQLRFLRSYREIRPVAECCREWIVRVDFEAMMRTAIAEAKTSRQEGNKGYGAVITLGARVLAVTHDTAATEKDPSQHAELKAIRQAAHTLGDANLCGCILFSTCEPCPMCASLAAWANVTTIVYGASIAETVKLGKSRIQVGAREIAEKSPAMVEVIGGVLGEECLSLYA